MSAPRQIGVRAGRLIALVVCSLTVAIVAGPAAGGRAGVTVTLTALSPPTQSQGVAFDFKIQVTNGDTVSRSVTVVERLIPVANPSSFVEFVSHKPTLPPGGSKTFTEDVATPQYFAQMGDFKITPYIDGAPAGNTLQFQVTAPAVIPGTFQDVTAAAGVGTSALPGPECDGQLSAGAAWGDFDDDGDLDLYLPLPDQNAKLFINDGTGHFTDRAAQAGVTNTGSIGRAAVAADYDNDGDQDLYVVNEGPARLYRNIGNLTFTDVTGAAGVGNNQYSPTYGTSASWGDYDNDGFLDLYVTNYSDCAGSGQNDKLYHNEGNGTFTDQTALLEHGAGCADGCTRGYGFQAAWFDYDRDRDLDLYLANDFNFRLPNPDVNHLWRNDGPDGLGGWTFTDVTAQAKAAPADLQSMGIGVADMNGDLTLDLAISDIFGNQVLRNNGNGTFTEVSDAANLDRPWALAGLATINWGLAFYDFNLDGWEDLYVASGAILVPGQGSTDPRHNQVFMNRGGGTGKFADLSALSGADTGLHSRGVAFADFDRDGRMDMYVVNHLAGPILYRNTTTTTGHWIEVDPVGSTTNKDGCGAVILITVGTKRILRQVYCGSVSLGSGNDPYVHFGLGSATVIDKMLVVWPSGKKQVRTNVPVDKAIKVIEP